MLTSVAPRGCWMGALCQAGTRPTTSACRRSMPERAVPPVCPGAQGRRALPVSTAVDAPALADAVTRPRDGPKFSRQGEGRSCAAEVARECCCLRARSLVVCLPLGGSRESCTSGAEGARAPLGMNRVPPHLRLRWRDVSWRSEPSRDQAASKRRRAGQEVCRRGSNCRCHLVGSASPSMRWTRGDRCCGVRGSRRATARRQH